MMAAIQAKIGAGISHAVGFPACRRLRELLFRLLSATRKWVGLTAMLRPNWQGRLLEVDSSIARWDWK